MVARCREFFNICSNSSDPDQRVPVGPADQGLDCSKMLLEFVEFHNKTVKKSPNSKLGMVKSAVLESFVILFRGERVNTLHCISDLA